MKKYLFFAIILIFQVDAFSQIPNGGFEDWEQIQNFEKPISWETNQDTSFLRFEKDSISVEGNYSLKVVASSFTAWTNCTSGASTGIKLQTPVGENKSLTFFVKSIPDSSNQFETVFCRIQGIFFVGGNLETTYEWETLDPINNFKKIQIP